MIFVSFFSWWYGAGWKQVIQNFGPRLTGVSRAFSVNQLLKTLFAPWRRIISYPGSTFGDKMHAWADNAFSRSIGFVIRLFVLLTAGISMVVIAVVSALEVAAWPLLPIFIPLGFIAGIIGATT